MVLIYIYIFISLQHRK